MRWSMQDEKLKITINEQWQTADIILPPVPSKRDLYPQENSIRRKKKSSPRKETPAMPISSKTNAVPTFRHYGPTQYYRGWLCRSMTAATQLKSEELELSPPQAAITTPSVAKEGDGHIYAKNCQSDLRRHLPEVCSIPLEQPA